jgi:hypothetical protein
MMSMPIDFWVFEAFPVLSALTTPHFTIGWALLLVIFALVFRAFRDGSLRDAALAGAATFILILFHPYHAPTIFFVAGLALIVMSVIDLRLFWKRALSLAVVLLMTMPAVAYHWWLLRPERNGPHALSGNVCWTPHITLVALGLGAFLPLAVAGVVLWRRRRVASEYLPGVFLITWIVGQAAMLYAPTMLQRRFSQGLLFPLAMFSGIALAALVRWVRKQPASGRHVQTIFLYVAVAILFLLTPFYLLRENVVILKHNRPLTVYFTKDETAMLSWMRENVPERSVVASSQQFGSFLPAWSATRSYLGHWGQTIDLMRKRQEMTALYGPTADASSLRELLDKEGIEYVYYGSRERLSGGELDHWPFLKEIHREGNDVLYRVQLDK